MNVRRGPLTVLILSQLFAGVGVASGVAVGGLLAEKISGTVTLAGFAQTSTVLGAGIIAIPLAKLAAWRGRRWALSLGYALAFTGTLLIFSASALMSFPLLLVGLGAFGAATAAGLQSRFAATEIATPAFQARSMSIVLWSTTIGSVAGPNLSQAGSDLGERLGIEPLTGPYLFSLVAFSAAVLLLGLFLRTPDAGRLEEDDATHVASVGVLPALRAAAKNRDTLFAIIAITCSHMVMVGVMVMTPVHMHNNGFSLDLVGLVISVHIIGMYGASPLMGWLTDKIGPRPVIFIGVAIFAVALVLGAFADQHDGLAISFALGILGLGWSAGMIGGSSLLTRAAAPELRVPLQGATDSVMNIAAASSSALSGAILAAGGFLAVNGVAAVVLIPLVVFGVRAVSGRMRMARSSAS